MTRRTFISSVGILTALMTLAGCSTSKTHSAVTPVPRTDQWWLVRHASFNARAERGEVDLIFIGNSITHSWEDAGREVWDKYYGHRNAMNLGISGDRTQHVLWRLDNGNLEGIEPKVAVLMIGTNNSNGMDNTPQEIADGILAIVARLRAKLPRTKILVLGIFPRGEKPNPQREKIAKTNQIVRNAVDGNRVHYMEIGMHFLEPDGTISKEIMPDYLHLTPRGYEIWAIAIEQKLRELLGETG